MEYGTDSRQVKPLEKLSHTTSNMCSVEISGLPSLRDCHGPVIKILDLDGYHLSYSMREKQVQIPGPPNHQVLGRDVQYRLKPGEMGPMQD